MLIYDRAAGSRINCNFTSAGNFVLRNKTNRKQQCITFNELFCSSNRLTVRINCRNSNSFYTLFTMNLYDCVAELQRNIKVFNTLNNITTQTRTERHNLADKLYLSTFQSQAAGHNQTDITRAEYYNLTSWHIAVDIYETLGSTRCKDTGRSCSRNDKGTAGSFTTTGRKNNSLSSNLHKTIYSIDCSYAVTSLTFFYLKHHGVGFIFDSKLLYFI